MSEERPHHPQEPAEGAEEAEGAPGAERAGEDDGGRQEDQERSVEHSQEPAEGAEEALGAKRTEGALALAAYRPGPKYVAQLVEAPPHSRLHRY